VLALALVLAMEQPWLCPALLCGMRQVAFLAQQVAEGGMGVAAAPAALLLGVALSRV
jgi:hypothetical protein